MPYTRAWTKEEDSLGKKLLEEGRRVEEVAAALDRSVESVSIRKRNVWGIRRIRKGPKTDVYFFDTWSPETAYVLGFIISDGHVRKDGKAVIIVQSHAEGRAHLKKLQKILGGSMYYSKNDDSQNLTLMGTYLVERLVELGVPKGKKSHLCIFPSSLPKEWLSHFCRGIFDGDGAISGTVTKKGQLNYSVSVCSGNHEFCEILQREIGAQISSSGSVYQNEAGVSYLSYSVNDSKALREWMYKGAEDLFLEWKRDQFDRLFQAKNVQRAFGASRLRRDLPVEGYPETPEQYSAFSPQLAELIVEMWSDPADLVVDPFSGWGTRAEAALRVERRYLGFDVSSTALQRTVGHLEKYWAQDSARWSIRGEDGCRMESISDGEASLVFSCPPYWNLEKYEDAPEQLSATQSYSAFLGKIRELCFNTRRVLKEGGYAVFVAGSFRRNDQYISFQEDLFQLLRNSGMVPCESDELSSIVLASRSYMRNAKFKTLGVSRESVLVFKKDSQSTAAPLSDDIVSRIRALENRPKKKVRRKPKTTWTREEDQILREQFPATSSVKELSASLGRSVSGVHKRAKLLGVERDLELSRKYISEKRSKQAKERWKDPKQKDKLSRQMQSYWSDAQNREAQSERITEWHQSKMDQEE